MWGQKSFDKSRFPSPDKMIESLHKAGVHFMISIWPSMDEKCANYKEMKEQGRLLSGVNICNAFDEEARKLYWKQAKEGLADYGVDFWWCDSSEPVTPEWNHVEQQLPEAMFSEYVKTAEDVMPVEKSNTYGYYHAKGMYEGQIQDFPQRHVWNLTRNGYLGSQKYSVTVWSGDICATWDVLQKQVVAAVQFSLSGLPYWTLDIGGFFVKQGVQWYWKGDYPTAAENPGYRELYTRWLVWLLMVCGWRNRPKTVAGGYKWNEDGFWSGLLSNSQYPMKQPSPEEALYFAFERYPKEMYNKIGQLPMGCHAWRKYEYEKFWKYYI